MLFISNKIILVAIITMMVVIGTPGGAVSAKKIAKTAPKKEDQRCRNVKGRFTFQVVSEFSDEDKDCPVESIECAEGKVTGNLGGSHTYVATELPVLFSEIFPDLFSDLSPMDDEVIIATTANVELKPKSFCGGPGEIIAIDTGVIAGPLEMSGLIETGSASGILTILEGEGACEGVTGRLRYTGVLEDIVFDYAGTVCTQ